MAVMLQLMREAEVHLGQLTSMLRAPGVAALPGTVAIVAVKAAGSIALQRPFFFSKVLPVLLGLGHLAKVSSCEDLGNGCTGSWQPHRWK